MLVQAAGRCAADVPLSLERFSQVSLVGRSCFQAGSVEIPPQPPGTTYGVDANGNVFPVSPLTASPQPSWLDNHPCVIPGAIALGVDIGDLFTEGALTPWAVSYSAQALACDAIM